MFFPPRRNTRTVLGSSRHADLVTGWTWFPRLRLHVNITPNSLRPWGRRGCGQRTNRRTCSEHAQQRRAGAIRSFSDVACPTGYIVLAGNCTVGGTAVGTSAAGPSGVRCDGAGCHVGVGLGEIRDDRRLLEGA